jgi:polar amino acid transport system substrate-binding protein
LIKERLLLGFILTFLSMDVTAEEPVDLEISEWRPYAYLEKNEPTGLAYEIVKAVFERADIAYEFRIKPWARVYKNGLNKKNYFILGLGRTLDREELFQWIAPITKRVNIHFYKLKNNPIQINNIEEAKKYLTGVERGSYYQDFIDAQFSLNKRHLLITPEQLLRMLILKRVDFILLEEARVLSISKNLGVDPNLFEKSLFAFGVQNYLVASLNTEDALVGKLKKAYAELKEENLINLH